MNHLLKQTKLPLSLRLIKEAHEVLLKGTRGHHCEPGEFRRSQNWIGPEGSTLRDATFVPPPVPAMTQSLYDLEEFLHTQDDLPPLVKIGLVHAQFETIHPFLDGNGRVGRLLITHLLTHYGLLSKPVLYLSLALQLNRNEYYSRLQAIRDLGQWEEWIEFFLQCIQISANDGARRAREILELKERCTTRIALIEPGTGANLLVILRHLFRQPLVAARDVAEIADCSHPTATRYIKSLVRLGILAPGDRDAVGQRYWFEEYLEILEQETIAETSDQQRLF